VKSQFLVSAARAALVTSLVLSAAAIAQSASAADATATATDQATTLPEVIVQARRVSENQERVPVAVTTLSTQHLREDTVTQVSDLAKSVPSFEVDPGSLGGAADPVFTVRGLSGALVADPSVVAYFDQVATDPRNFAYSMYDLESVQVLKGPQGTLFGKNSTGGAVTFAPIRPSQNFGGYVDFRYGNYNDTELSGAINLPIISDKLALRVAGDFENRDGTLSSTTGGGKYNDRDHGSVRAELLFTPNSHYENYLEATVYQVRENGNQFLLSGVEPCPTPGAISAPQCAYEFPLTLGLGTTDIQQELAQQQTLGKNRTVSNFHSPFDVDYDAVTDIATARFGEITIKNIAHMDYARYHIAYDLTGTGAGILDQDDHQGNHNYSDELQFIGDMMDHRLNWLVGGYYNKFVQNEHEDFDLETFPGNPFSPQDISISQPQESKALFGQVTYDFSQWAKGISLTAGYRYTWDNRSITQQRLQPGGFEPSPVPPFFVIVPSCGLAGFPGLNNATCTENLSTNFSNYNYNVSLNWQATDHTLLYVSSRRGYKSGGFNFAATDPAFIEYSPETVTDVEIGLKSDWRLGEMPVRTNLAAYQGKYDNIQAQFVSTSPSGLPEALIVNQDPITGTKNKATLTGGEAEVTIIPVRQVTLSGYYGYASGKYDQFIDSASGTPISLAGQAVEGIANNTFGLNLQYHPEISGFTGPMTLSADLYNRSKESANALNPSAIGGYTNLDLRFDWRNAMGGPIDVAVYGTNVTNDRHVIIDNNLLNVVGVEAKQFADPTMYGIELRYHFGA